MASNGQSVIHYAVDKHNQKRENREEGLIFHPLIIHLPYPVSQNSISCWGWHSRWQCRFPAPILASFPPTPARHPESGSCHLVLSSQWKPWNAGRPREPVVQSEAENLHSTTKLKAQRRGGEWNYGIILYCSNEMSFNWNWNKPFCSSRHSNNNLLMAFQVRADQSNRMQEQQIIVQYGWQYIFNQEVLSLLSLPDNSMSSVVPKHTRHNGTTCSVIIRNIAVVAV